MSEIKSGYVDIKPPNFEKELEEIERFGETFKGMNEPMPWPTGDEVDRNALPTAPDGTATRSPGPLDAFKAMRCRPKSLPSLGELAKGKVDKGGVQCKVPIGAPNEKLEPEK